MFTGIVEAQSKVFEVSQGDGVIRVKIEKPSYFKDIKLGDSVSVDGVCLTVEAFDDESMDFAVANETLKITSWSQSELLSKLVNLERPLSVNSRLHGHWVTGHVDTVLKIIDIKHLGENKILTMKLPKKYKLLVVAKGSITLNGVALTINDVTQDTFNVCLIPETLNQTNLKLVKTVDHVTAEFDYLVKIINKSLDNYIANGLIQNKDEAVKKLGALNA